MISRKIILNAVWLVAILAAPAAHAFDDGDFQAWNTDSVAWELNQKWKMQFEEELRWGDDAGDFFYQHSDLGVVYSGLAKWLDVGVNYRHILEEKNSVWKVENQPHLNATVKWKLGEYSLSDRSRFEYRNREDADDFWRYRNNFTVKFPFKFTRRAIQPYLAEEFFYDFDAEAVNQNRLAGGVGLELWRQAKAELYYMWQSQKSNDRWIDSNILGTKIRLSF